MLMKSTAFILSAWLGMVSVGFGQTPPPNYAGVPRVSSVSPAGWHRGDTVEVIFSGTRLQQPRGVLFPESDLIRCRFIEPVVPDPKAPPSESGKAKAILEIAPDCPTGPHYARLFTNYGIAEVVTFWVGALPTITEAEPTEKLRVNNTLETAVPVAQGSTINGWLTNDDEDVYQWKAKAGQLISAEIECARMAVETEDGTELQLNIRDAAGKVIATADDTPLFLADPFLSLKAPADGTYFITVKPLLPSVNARRIAYRLHLGDFIRPAGLYPSGGAPGTTITAKILGVPDGFASEAKIDLPKQASNTAYKYRADRGTATPNVLRLLDAPNLLEVEPNDDPATATRADGPLPVALNGILEKPGDVDHFKFSARKGDRFIVSSFAQALGSPADLQMSILPAAAKPGQNSEKADDATDADLDHFETTYTRQKLDPRMLFTAKDDGEYVLSVRDVRSGGSPISVYRIEFREPSTAILAGMYNADNDARRARISSHVGRGNRALFLMNVRPTFGTEKITGELQVTAKNLPKGVTMTAPKFTIEQRRIPLMFEAAADAPVTAAMLEFQIAPVDPNAVPLQTIFSHNIGMTYANGDMATVAHFDRLAFSVTDEIPFQVKVTAPTVPLSRNGEILLDVEVTRSAGYKEPIELGVENAPQGFVPQTGTVLSGDQTKTTLRIGAEGAAPIGAHQLCVTARNRVNGEERFGRLRATSNAFTVELAEPFLRIKLARSSIERGKKSLVKATIERIRPLPGSATAKLIRLPKGLEMASGPISIPDDAKELTLELLASPDALVGTYNNIACEVAVAAEGKELKQIVGTGLVRVDPARK
jgi:hypothetical protein